MYLAGDSAGSEGKGGLLKQKQLNPYVKPLPSKSDILRLLESCSSPGAKLAVGLAAFSGLHPRQVKELVFRNLVEFSLAKKQFLEVPSRIQMMEAVGNRRSTVVRYCTFLSSRGCEWLLEDLKSRSPPPRAESPVVTEQAFTEAERAVQTAGLRWHDLRDYFWAACVKVGIPHYAVDFMLGHVLRGSDRFRNLSAEVSYLRKQYVKVEQLFV